LEDRNPGSFAFTLALIKVGRLLRRVGFQESPALQPSDAVLRPRRTGAVTGSHSEAMAAG
jgi:hypothetical protein